MRNALLLTVVVLGAWPLESQTPTEQQFIASVNDAIDAVVSAAGKPTHPIIMGANLVFANGALVNGVPLDVLLDYVDGLKASGAQRIELNPSVTTINDPVAVAKYDAIVLRTRELGLQLAINPQFTKGEFLVTAFSDFQTVALPAYQQLAARYKPDNFVIVHEPDTMTARMGITGTVSDWHNFILAAAPLIQTASPHTRIGAGCFYNSVLPQILNFAEDSYFQDFATIAPLDFLTMDIYSTDFAQFQSWAQTAHTANKGVYAEEVWAPHYLPSPLPANWATFGSLDNLAVIGAASPDFETMDQNWLQGVAVFASANNMEAMTPFTTETFFTYGTAGHYMTADPVYMTAVEQALLAGQLSQTGLAYVTEAQQSGIATAANVSSASYATLPSVFNPHCGTSTNPCNAETVIAPDSLESAFGADLATTIATDGTFPTQLGGTTATLVDSTNTTYFVPLYYVAPQQVNYYVPSQAQAGPATLTINSADGTQTIGWVRIAPIMPGLYTADSKGQGPPAAIAVCAGVCDGWQNQNGTFYQNAFTCNGAGCAPLTIHLASTDTVVVELFGTGIRHLTPGAASATVGGQSAPVQFTGAQGQYMGLDQVNVQLPQSLAGAGNVSLVLTLAETQPVTQANIVTLNVQ